MSDNLSLKLHQAKRQPKPEPEHEQNPKDMTREQYIASLPSDADRRAYASLLAEAKKNHATLDNDGRGGLPPKLVWMRMRKDRWKCKKCGGRDNLSVHHKAGAENMVGPAVAALGHRPTMKAIVTICGSCHDDIHNEDRAEGEEAGEQA